MRLLLKFGLGLFIFYAGVSFGFATVPDWLLMSNRPESISAEGVLYASSNIHGVSRLVVFHKNDIEEPGFLVIQVKTDQQSTLSYHGGEGGPDKSELYVGQNLAKEYWTDLKRTVSFNGEWTRVILMQPHQVFGAMYDFSSDGKATYDVQIYFVINYPAFSSLSCPPRLPVEVYRYHDIEETVVLREAGVRYNLSIGKTGYLQSDENTLYGNFGVVHRYYLRFKQAGKYEILFTANGGPARVVFRLDGKLYEGYASSDTRISQFQVDVPREGVLETFPLSGSNYPATLTIIKKK